MSLIRPSQRKKVGNVHSQASEKRPSIQSANVGRLLPIDGQEVTHWTSVTTAWCTLNWRTRRSGSDYVADWLRGCDRPWVHSCAPPVAATLATALAARAVSLQNPLVSIPPRSSFLAAASTLIGKRMAATERRSCSMKLKVEHAVRELSSSTQTPRVDSQRRGASGISPTWRPPPMISSSI
eukprot:6214164-Pleurochrysis_carterae.AAC.1